MKCGKFGKQVGMKGMTPVSGNGSMFSTKNNVFSVRLGTKESLAVGDSVMICTVRDGWMIHAVEAG